MYKSRAEMLQSVYDEYNGDVDQIIALFSSDTVVNFVIRNEVEEDGFIGVLSEEGYWEIIRGEEAKITAQFYLAYTIGLLKILDEKKDSEDLDASNLFNN